MTTKRQREAAAVPPAPAIRWNVYKSVLHPVLRVERPFALGHVNAPDAPRALAAAMQRWPDQADAAQPQNGFSVRPHAKDHLSLGKLHKRQNQQERKR
jgi:hypothetical protein